MTKLLATLVVLAGLMNSAHAAPAPDEIDKQVEQKGLISRLGDSIQQATDRAAELVLTSMGSLDTPYRLGGTSAQSGFDCSGFVRAMVQQAAGLMLPRTAADQAAATQAIDRDELKPGDLVFFNTMRRAYSHVGIYVGDGKFIHSPRSGSHVRVENMKVSYWQSRFNGARRVMTSEQTAAATDAPAASRSSSVIHRDSPAPRSVRLGGTFGKAASATAVDSGSAATASESI